MLVRDEVHDLATPTGPMRSYVYVPQGSAGKTFPGVVLYSEIFQQTEPIRRLALQFAGQGYVVLVPEVYHEHEPPGTVLGYDDAGKDKGNRYKVATKLSTYDADARAALDALERHPACNGRLGTVGVCLGGHLAFRAAFDTRVRAAACYYPTDIHSATLGLGQQDDTLARCGELRGEVLLVWGRQDPHIPAWGRRKIYEALEAADVLFTWHEFNAQHAFLRDEGERYDPGTARLALGLGFDLLRRAF